MRIEQRRWTPEAGWSEPLAGAGVTAPQLVLFFGSRDGLNAGVCKQRLRALYPNAAQIGCSTSGEICGVEVSDGTVVATAIELEHSTLRTASVRLADASQSADAGARLARELAGDGLVHLFVLAEGLKVNGTELVKGLRDALPREVAVTGGLAGDAAKFEQTYVCYEGEALDGAVAGVAFYGDRFRVGYGSMGGWDSFGPDRTITRSEGNVLYELDGSSALALYKSYLGPHAADLPASGLLFPLSLAGEGDRRVVRTILGVDESAGSLTFAGDMPLGASARLMKANVDRLIDGAHDAASASVEPLMGNSASVAFLISCVGRKLVLKQRVEEEVESVREVLGPDTVLSGFYSYGEIAPFSSSARCELHNQTMTITTFTER
jgi:hypothetical protein